MNWLLYWAFSAFILLACGSADNKPAALNDATEKFESKYVRLANDTNHLIMVENVVVRFGDLYAEADSAFYEKPEKTITLYAVKKLVFRGTQMHPAFHQSVKYTKGDKKLRVN